MLLAGDIGGTKTHLALLEARLPLAIVAEKKYPSRDYAGLEQIVSQFLKEYPGSVRGSCFGIAGPIREGRCHATNLPWKVDSSVLSKQLRGAPAHLINDLEANAYGLSCLAPDEMRTLQVGRASRANRALIAAGTGLGEAGLFWDGEHYHPFACEGGHCDFGPRSELELDLWRYLAQKFSHVSYERVLSGPGVLNLYQFLVEKVGERAAAETIKRIEKEDPAKVITEMARKGCQASLRTMRWFSSIYGAESSNLALKTLALGGLFLGGGIAPKILDFLEGPEFMQSFLDKGRFRALLEEVPIRVVLNEKTALLGSAFYALERLGGRL